MADGRYTLSINVEERDMLSSLLYAEMARLRHIDRYSSEGLTDLEEKDLGTCIHLHNMLNDSFMEYIKKKYPVISEISKSVRAV